MSLPKPAEMLYRNMSIIKEKVQQIVQQAEADTVAKKRRKEEDDLQWIAVCQERVRQYEALKTDRLEKGKKALEATGVQRVFGEVLDILREEDPEVQLQIREGQKYYSPGSRSLTDRKYERDLSRVLGPYDENKIEKREDEYGSFVETVVMAVEKERGEGEVTTRLGVELSVGDPRKLWIISAFGIYEQEDILAINDKDLFPKLKNRLAQNIAQRLHRHFNHVPEDWETSGGW